MQRPNSSFEDLTICYGFDMVKIINAPPWRSATTEGSPDLYNLCMDLSGIQAVPKSVYGYQWPHTGGGFVGGYAWGGNNGVTLSDGSEYPCVKLTQPLEQRKMYRIGFYTVLAEESKYSTGTFGIYLSPTEISVPGLDLYGVIEPQINFFLTPEGRDTGNWILLEDTFYSQSGAIPHLW